MEDQHNDDEREQVRLELEVLERLIGPHPIVRIIVIIVALRSLASGQACATAEWVISIPTRLLGA